MEMVRRAVASLLLLISAIPFARSYKYDLAYAEYNLNENQYALSPREYWGEWGDGHSFRPSPENWRVPFYTLFLDRFVNGDPSNDNANGTLFEHDLNSNQMRHGGDLEGLMDTLDYIQGMGIKALYIAGSPFLNQPWGYDQYSPVDLTLLDAHFGTLATWRKAITAIHARGMHVVLDNTIATLGDLIGFEGYLNETAPFATQEHRVQWKSDRRYLDFEIGNTYNATCQYPRFWNETGFPVDPSVHASLVGCYDSDFDQFGDTEAFGVYPDWRRQLTKFASVQDRLREWHPPVRERLENFYCMLIAQLDIDGYRYDKAAQSTPDAMAALSSSLRTCARRYGKENFYITGELTSGNDLASIYLGRGRQPDQVPANLTQAIALNANSSDDYFLRAPDQHGIDSGAFHYTVYRTLTRWLGLDGNLEAGYDAPRNWIDMWNTFVLSNDLINANTGVFDPRHMMGVTNQDVFRWPAITKGLERQVLGHFVTTILMPGIPKLLWGEEQAYYVLDSTNSNYLFGRQPMSSATAWQTHGCYALDSTQYFNMPWNATRNGCRDDKVSNDHRDPSAPVRNILRRMYQLRDYFPVLQDGFFLQQLSNQTFEVQYPGSSGVVTETGVWSVVRSAFEGFQDLSNRTMPGTNGNNNNNASSALSDTPVWLVYTNVNESRTFEFDCRDNSTDRNTTALIAPFEAGTAVKNLFYPYDELTLDESTQSLGFRNSTRPNGCLGSLEMQAYDFRAYVPTREWKGPEPVLTSFSPGHDARILSQVPAGGAEEVHVELEFSMDMDCDNVTRSITFESRTQSGNTPSIQQDSVQCRSIVEEEVEKSPLVAGIPSQWLWTATLGGVEHGVHRMTVNNAKMASGESTTAAKDHFLFRIGQANNPVVFPRSANYSSTLLVRTTETGKKDALLLNHTAAGADLFRYSTNFGTTFSDWQPYVGGMQEIEKQAWSGTDLQKWKGEHVRVEYFSRFAGSSDHVQQGDVGSGMRRFPNMFLNGPYNAYGFDAGKPNQFQLHESGEWKLHWMTEWSPSGAVAQINVWGINPDGQPDQSMVLGDINGDSVLDRLPPSSLKPVTLNVTEAPPKPYLAWSWAVDDGSLQFRLEPRGNMWFQLALYVIFWLLPILSGVLATRTFIFGFYRVKFNKLGAVSEKINLLPLAIIRRPFQKARFLQEDPKPAFDVMAAQQRTVLIATMEYDIEDWNIKIKIGGLGVMSQLMGKNLPNLIWVVPCVGGVDYPEDEVADPMLVTTLGTTYRVGVQYHQLRNITYVLLDAPVFRKQTKAEPYPARMDDMESAVYYSAWNQCIAQAIQRFPAIDIYHINDYHGTIAPLYLLPRTIPVCLSLHNAEFQGLWPMRTAQEIEEICLVFNLPVHTATQYVQFGQVFNLLHAGASLLRKHQEGYGAVGVSKKYGRRSHARYPILWGLSEVQALQNPDPSDTGALEQPIAKAMKEEVQIDEAFEMDRLEHRRQAQEWAGLEQDPTAQLFVFVGRWSMQKGVDLIADAFPSILEANPNVQLITIGPVIDLYGKFAALKLDVLMKKYPKRVFSKPEFTALPPCIFTGAEFALIPSRDEPFGLVAVEFGRKGALGIGARVGGLGQMPGWWYTVESTSTIHLLTQFKGAIREALHSSTERRAKMRAISAKQRFPVAAWVHELATLQSNCIRLHDKVRSRKLALASTANLVESRMTAAAAAPPAAPATTHLIDSRMSSAPTTGRNSLELDEAPDNLHTTFESPRSSKLVERTTPRGEGGAGANALNPSGGLLGVNAMNSPPTKRASRQHHRELSLGTVVGNRTDYGLQKVDPFFEDKSGAFYRAFERKLETLDGKNSETTNCIEEYLLKSEKEWASNVRNARLGRHNNKSETNLSSIGSYYKRSRPSSPAPSLHPLAESAAPVTANANAAAITINIDTTTKEDFSVDEYELGPDYQPPRYLSNWMQIRLGSWPVYSFFLALGQIISANSYQITLLTGEIGQTAEKTYIIASIYLIASLGWWFMFRRLPAVYSLSIPFVFYGLAFLLIGSAHFSTFTGAGWIQNVGTGCYTVASASGALFFALNFGDDTGGKVESWVFRACVIQGTQQVWVVALWYWGKFYSVQSQLDQSLTATNNSSGAVVGTWKMTAIALPIAAVLWAMGLILFFGLPTYYRQQPGNTPAFYTSALRRKVVVWFAVAVLLQNFFMSAPYGRNWSFLFSSLHVEEWQVLLLTLGFFIGVWAAFLAVLGHLSKSHTWLFPVFAVGLGAPRFAQIWWGTSGMGLWLPWAGTFFHSALASRAVWLWLGVLDAIQGVGLGMILLGTLTREHVAFTVTLCQVLGSATTMLARGVAPNATGPGPISPDITQGIGALGNAWFWIGLLAQLAVCVGFLKVHRKEQLQKP